MKEEKLSGLPEEFGSWAGLELLPAASDLLAGSKVGQNPRECLHSTMSGTGGHIGIILFDIREVLKRERKGEKNIVTRK